MKGQTKRDLSMQRNVNLAIKRNEVLIHATAQMKFGIITLEKEASHTRYGMPASEGTCGTIFSPLLSIFTTGETEAQRGEVLP